MPLITQETSFVWNGHRFGTEMEAAEHAIREVGAHLLKNHNSNLAAGLLRRRDELIELLSVHQRLSADAQPPQEVTSEKATGEPMERTKYSLAQIDAFGHTKQCRVRATGYPEDCDCVEDEHPRLSKRKTDPKADWKYEDD